jgi:hypothetical protein
VENKRQSAKVKSLQEYPKLLSQWKAQNVH